MNKRLLLAGVLGGVAMFVWSGIAHMALPLGEAGVRQIDNERALFDAMKSTLAAPGFYIFPGMTPGGSLEQYRQKVATGPSGILIYFPSRDFVFGKALGVELLTALAQALLAVWLLSLTRARTFAARLAFYALLGLLASAATNISYWNWYGFPVSYTAAYMFTCWVGYLAAGLVAAGLKAGDESHCPVGAVPLT